MSEPSHHHSSERPLCDADKLSRFVFSQSHVRENGTVKPDAFMPPSNNELSVTRSGGLPDVDIWRRGNQIARIRSKPLVGRAEVTTAIVTGAGLEARLDPIPDDPEHALIFGWPSGKPLQKQKAQLLAMDATYQSHALARAEAGPASQIGVTFPRSSPGDPGGHRGAGSGGEPDHPR